MKRVVALVLASIMVLGCISACFAKECLHEDWYFVKRFLQSVRTVRFSVDKCSNHNGKHEHTKNVTKWKEKYYCEDCDEYFYRINYDYHPEKCPYGN